jgi:hypothetical protein
MRFPPFNYHLHAIDIPTRPCMHMHAACYLLAVVHAVVVRRGGVSFAFCYAVPTRRDSLRDNKILHMRPAEYLNMYVTLDDGFSLSIICHFNYLGFSIVGLALVISLVVKLTYLCLNPKFDTCVIFTVNCFFSGRRRPVDSETLLVTDFVNLKIKSA